MSLKDYLEELEFGEGENKFKLSKQQIKDIIAENGKIVNTETEKVKNEYKTTIDDLKSQLEKAPKSDEIENLKTQIADFEKKETERKEQEEKARTEKILNENILNVFGDKKFSSEYAKQGLLSDIKVELGKDENKGKGIKDIFEELTKDRTDIFANPNQVQDMPGMGDVDSSVSKEEFDKMSYKQRVEFKQSNPELFAKLNK